MKNNRMILIGMLSAAMSLTLVSPVKAKVVDSIALIVDQDAMTQSELDESIQSYFASQGLKTPNPGTPEYEAAKNKVVDAFIREVLLAEEADREKVEPEDGEVDHEVNVEINNMKQNFPTTQDFDDSLKSEGISLDDLKQDIREKITREIKASEMLRKKEEDLPGSVIITDDEARAYYEKHPTDYEHVTFSMILLRVSPKASPSEVKQVWAQAQNILKQAKMGTSFAALAKKYSEDPGSAADGGNVGTVTRDEIGDPQLADGVFAIKPHHMGLVRASSGIYIIKVDSIGKADFDSTAADIKAFLRKQEQDDAIDLWIDKLKKDAYIVEDGKVVNPSETFITAPVNLADNQTQENGPVTMTAAEEKMFSVSDNYPSLPLGGSFVPYVGGLGFLPDTQDLSNYYSPLNAAQAFPFGLGVYGGVDYSLETTLQVGVMGEVLRKFSESVTVSQGIEQWNSTAVGAGLEIKVLIPLDESTNFILNAEGGIYTLLDASVTIAGTEQNTNLSATNLGGEAGAALEFMLDSQKSTALDLGLDYRLLSFNPVTSSDSSFLGSPLMNAKGENGAVDFNGFVINAGLRFFLGKGSDSSS